MLKNPTDAKNLASKFQAFQSIVGDGKIHSMRSIIERITDRFDSDPKLQEFFIELKVEFI
jgi:hypothetical protein